MSPLTRRSLLGSLSGLAVLTAVPPAAATATAGRSGTGPGHGTGSGDGDAVLDALARAARPLRSTDPEHGDERDLAPLGAALGSVPVVALGEVAHGTHEITTLRHRVFRYLVRAKGFTAFALEVGWATGLRLNAYVRHGEGDPRALMERELGDGKWPWHLQEYLDLFRWMREHNVRHPDAPVEFLGMDFAYPRIDDLLFERVLGYVAEHHPAHRAEFAEGYRELWEHAAEPDFSALPQPERRRIAARARRAARDLQRLGAGADPHPDPDRVGFAWTVQHARVIAQSATLLAYDLTDEAEIPLAMRYRDWLMAENTAWWHRHTGQRMLLAAHSGHTAYVTYEPESYPKIQGEFLRETLGADYLSIGTTFGAGTVTVPDGDGVWREESFGPPRPGSSEHALERAGALAGAPDFLLDPRTAPRPARDWLHATRPTRDIGPPGDPYRPYALGAGHDLLVHLRRFRAATPLE